MNFGKEIIDKLERIYFTLKVVIKVYGKLTSIINLEKGLPQGDPFFLEGYLTYASTHCSGMQKKECVVFKFLKSAAFLDGGNLSQEATLM